MQIVKLISILLFGLFAFNQCKSGKRVDVEITLSDSNGDATNMLNSLTKKTEGGKMTSSSDGVLNYEIIHKYRIENSKLYCDLLFKRKESKDISWSKEIDISKDGKSMYDPFLGIAMKVNVKGN